MFSYVKTSDQFGKMVQTRKGASNSEWLQLIKECGVLYRERKRRLVEESDLENQNALPTPCPPTKTTTTRKRKAQTISPAKAVDAPGDCEGAKASGGGGKAQETA